jgi:hypothetical protein
MNVGGVPNTCKSSEKAPSGVSTAANGCLTRKNLPFSEEYSREIEFNTAYTLRGKGGFMLPLKDELAGY